MRHHSVQKIFRRKWRHYAISWTADLQSFENLGQDSEINLGNQIPTALNLGLKKIQGKILRQDSHTNYVWQPESPGIESKIPTAQGTHSCTSPLAHALMEMLLHF